MKEQTDDVSPCAGCTESQGDCPACKENAAAATKAVDFHRIDHSIKERQYICLLLNRLFNHIYPEPLDNQTEVAMEWLATIRQVDGIMISVRGGYTGEPFSVGHFNNYDCFTGEYK